MLFLFECIAIPETTYAYKYTSLSRRLAWHSVLTTEIVCDANLALEERIASFEFVHRKIELEGVPQLISIAYLYCQN